MRDDAAIDRGDEHEDLAGLLLNESRITGDVSAAKLMMRAAVRITQLEAANGRTVVVDNWGCLVLILVVPVLYALSILADYLARH